MRKYQIDFTLSNSIWYLQNAYLNYFVHIYITFYMMHEVFVCHYNITLSH